jgi:thiamine-phosphate pyrophosphorylase
MLGFIESDAEVIGRAWLARGQRTRPQGLQSPSLREPAEADQAELAWPDHPDDFGLPAWPRDGSFAPCPAALELYVVAPDAQWIARLAQWGVPTVQLRFKPAEETQEHGEAQAQVRAQVQAAVRAVEGTATRLFINDYWRFAMEEGAYGVHLGQEDMSLLSEEDLDRMRQAGLRLGLSTHGYAEMLRAEAVGPSYLAMGAVYPTTLKAMPTAPQGPHRLAAYARLMRDRSVVAIGGIDESRLDEVVRTGVGSVAVVRAVIGAPDPEAAVRSLMQRVSGHPSS